MKPFRFLVTLSLTVATVSALTSPSPTVTSPPSSAGYCVVGGSSCPEGFTCHPSTTCSGLCVQTPFPPVVPCNVGEAFTRCPAGSMCQLTTSCEPGVPSLCGGTCTNFPSTTTPAATTESLHISCVVGSPYYCPATLKCSPTAPCPTYSGAVCWGLCEPSTTSGCIVGGPSCPMSQACSPTTGCGGSCVATPTPSVY